MDEAEKNKNSDKFNEDFTETEKDPKDINTKDFDGEKDFDFYQPKDNLDDKNTSWWNDLTKSHEKETHNDKNTELNTNSKFGNHYGYESSESEDKWSQHSWGNWSNNSSHKNNSWNNHGSYGTKSGDSNDSNAQKNSWSNYNNSGSKWGWGRRN